MPLAPLDPAAHATQAGAGRTAAGTGCTFAHVVRCRWRIRMCITVQYSVHAPHQHRAPCMHTKCIAHDTTVGSVRQLLASRFDLAPAAHCRMPVHIAQRAILRLPVVLRLQVDLTESIALLTNLATLDDQAPRAAIRSTPRGWGHRTHEGVPPWPPGWQGDHQAVADQRAGPPA